MMKRWTVLIMVLILVQKTAAQICNGSLGDPIINITFGSGTNPGPPLTAATTSYQYLSIDCPSDGFYAIRNSTNSCFGNTWHSITDHTGNTNGYFMLVNASLQPSAFYLDTVRQLCGNTTYEFAAWILNILKPTSCGGNGNQPNLTFSIERTDGTLLQSYNTAQIPATNSPQWKQYGFFFTTPSATSDIVLRIINNSQGGCGNDLALDDITFRACGPQINTSIAGTTASTVSVCEGTSQNYTFNGNVSVGFNTPVVQWQQRNDGGTWSDIQGETSLSYTRNFSSSISAGNFTFRLTATEAGNLNTPQCRVASTPMTIEVLSNPLAAASVNSPICEGGNITMKSIASNADWSGPNGFVANGSQATINNAQQVHSGKYYVTTVNGSCNRFDSVTISVSPKPLLVLNKEEVILCEGDSTQLIVSGADSYNWYPSTAISSSTESTVFLFPSDSSTYTVIGKNNAGCSDTIMANIFVINKPMANAGPDKNVMEGSTTQLSGTAAGDSISYYWTGENIALPQSFNPSVEPLSNGSYIFHVISNLGCGLATDTTEVHVFKKLKIPNAFSPNSDGINDTWNIGGIDTYSGAVVTIFNRHGQQVFHINRFTGWNGRYASGNLPVGTYYYIINVHNDLPLLSGWLLVIY
jgi:gliding motility-associated-like protein